MSYRTALLKVINDWKVGPIEDEWLFENFRDEFVSVMSSSEAFESIADTVDIMLSEDDESTVTEILQTIIMLARRSNTTEVPARLLARKSEVVEMFASFGDYSNNKLDELFEYYRI